MFEALATVGFFLSVICLCWLSGLTSKGPREGWQLRLVRKAYKEAMKDHMNNVKYHCGLIDRSTTELHRLEKQIKELEGKS